MRVRGALAGVAVTVLGLGLSGLAFAGTAAADGMGTPDGYTATAKVRFSGDAAPSGGSVQEVQVKAACWYERSPGAGFGGSAYDPDDAATVLKAYEAMAATGADMSELPPKNIIDEAVAAQAAGKTRTLLWFVCADFSKQQAAWNEPGRQIYAFSGDGLPPPPPVIDPEELAKKAQEMMVIPPPTVERNPKIDAQGGGTLVGLGTWFWVTNPESVGGADGTKSIRAEVIGTPVYAQVTAKTGGLSVNSPAGGASCPPVVATRAYSAGASDSGGCTVAFSRASVGLPGGYAVVASTDWTASWTGLTQGGATRGGALPPLQFATTVNVPVAETQALVTGSR